MQRQSRPLGLFGNHFWFQDSVGREYPPGSLSHETRSLRSAGIS
jgi:hypothetical protein